MRPMILLLLLLPTIALAQAGRFLLAVGDVVVVRGAAEIRAGAGTPVESGDTIRVGVDSNAQIRLTDESIVGLRAGTVLRLDDYFYSGSVDGREKTLISLLKGGFRTVTGVIGRLQDRNKYAVRTPTSTIGIRGTHYVVAHCDNDCGAAQRVSLAFAALAQADTRPGIGQAVANGTYGGVTNGRIEVANQTGERVFGANEFFYVASNAAAPQSLIAPPAFLYDRLPGQDRNKERKGQEQAPEGGGIDSESRPNDTPTPPAPNAFVVTEERTATGASRLLGATLDTALIAGWITPGSSNDLVAGGVLISQTALTIGPGGVLQAFSVPAGCIGPNPDCNQPPSGTLLTPAESGNATFPGSTQTVFWGRWASGTIFDSGQTIPLNATTHAHLMHGPLTPADVIAGKSGTLMLQSSFPGGLGTTPSNNFGALASAASLPDIIVDFTARTASVAPGWFVNFPNVGTGTQNWSFSGGSGNIVVAPGAGAYFLVDQMSGTCTSGGPATACNGGASFTAKGRTSGIFIGPVGDHAGVAIGGAAGTAQFNAVRVYCPTC